MVRNVTANLSPNPPADVVGILDDIASLAETRTRRGPLCSVADALERLAAADADIAAAVSARIDDEQYPATGVAKILTARTGVQVANYTLRRHRKRGGVDGCRCPR